MDITGIRVIDRESSVNTNIFLMAIKISFLVIERLTCGLVKLFYDK